MKQNLKLIAMDLDGTILLEDHRTIGPQTREALERAAGIGILLVPSTGRMRGILPPEVMGMKGVRYLIVSNGASVYDCALEKELFAACVEPEKVKQICDIAQTQKIYMELYSDGQAYTADDPRQVWKAYEGQPGRLALVKKQVNRIRSVEEFLRQGHPVEKVNIPYLRPEQWESFSPVTGVGFTSSLSGNLEINAYNTNKGAALEVLCSHLGIRREETAAFGDGGNDVEMLEFAGVGVAMGNAPAFVKERARYVTESNEEEGVAKFLERII